MHLPDALVSPAVGSAALLLAGGLCAVGARRMGRDRDPRRVATAGVLGAFVFAAQMVNFAIPGTGFSGHLGGGVLLAILVGPWAAVPVMAAILLVQAVLFADGGLLAWGCNVLNMGALPALVAWGLVGRALADRGWRRTGVFAAATLGLLLGASAVVVEVALSGVTGVATPAFAALVLPVHLAIGVAEGLATVATVAFLERVAPEAVAAPSAPRRAPWAVPAALVAATATACVLAWFASARPDGLEWSVERAALPVAAAATATPALDAGAPLAGLVGSAVVLLLVAVLGLLLRRAARATG